MEAKSFVANRHRLYGRAVELRVRPFAPEAVPPPTRASATY